MRSTAAGPLEGSQDRGHVAFGSDHEMLDDPGVGAAVVGASGVAGISRDVAKWLVIIIVVLPVLTYVL